MPVCTVFKKWYMLCWNSLLFGDENMQDKNEIRVLEMAVNKNSLIENLRLKWKLWKSWNKTEWSSVMVCLSKAYEQFYSMQNVG